MKRILALCALSLGCSTAMANTGIIDFEGTIRAGGTCPIDVVTPGGPGLPKIYLGNYKVDDFTAIGQKTEMQKFALRVDPAKCTIPPSGTTTVIFSPTWGSDPSGKLYAVRSGTGYSEGFALAIYDKDGQLDPDTKSVEYPLSDTAVTDMNFTAQLHTIAAKVTEGHLSSSVNFLVDIP